jgi:pimeloyl-ACP methyl ester carboxylesterase
MRRLLPLLLLAGCIGIPIHARTKAKPVPAPTKELPFEWVSIPAGGETVLRGIWCDDGGPAVLLLYGSGMGIAGIFEAFTMLHDAGYKVLCCDYRGTGWSSGRWWSSRHLDDDARALWEWMLQRSGRPAGVFGISIGAIAASGLLSHPSPPDAVVLDRPVDPKTVIARYMEKEAGPIASAISTLVVRARCDVDLGKEWREAKAPALLVLPSHDVLCPPQDMARLVGDLPANVEKRTLRGGHLSTHLLEPRLWRSTILDWLDGRLRPGQPALGGRDVPQDPLRVEAARLDGRTLHVTLPEGPLPDRVRLLLCGRGGNAVVAIENPLRESTLKLPGKEARRLDPLFGARVVPEEFPGAIATHWIGVRPPAPPRIQTVTPDRSE